MVYHLAVLTYYYLLRQDLQQSPPTTILKPFK
jgi:hypothetical protein